MRFLGNATLRTVRFAQLAGALAFALGVLSVAPAARAQLQNASKDVLAKEKSAELQSLKQRAANLVKQMNGPSSTNTLRKTDLQRDWNNLLSDFDQWATKFHVQSQEQMLPAYAVNASGHPIPKNYPLLAEGPPGIAGFFCMKDFTRSTDAQFAHRCYKE